MPLARVQRIEILDECDTPRGWVYRLEVHFEDGAATQHEASMSWVDHEHWTSGRIAPSRVIEAVVRFVLEHECVLPQKFDAATARRWCRDIDRDLPAMIEP